MSRFVPQWYRQYHIILWKHSQHRFFTHITLAWTAVGCEQIGIPQWHTAGGRKRAAGLAAAVQRGSAGAQHQHPASLTEGPFPLL